MQTIRRNIGMTRIAIVAALLAAGLFALLPQPAAADHLATPGNVTVTAQPGALLVSWDRVPVTNKYGTKHYYWVRYRTSSPQGEWQGDNGLHFRIRDGASGCNGERCSFSLSNDHISRVSQARQGPYPALVPGTAYDVQVSAAGIIGRYGQAHHQYAAPVSAVFGVPATPDPTVESQPGALTVTWAAVSGNGAEVKAYTVQWKKSADAAWDPQDGDSGLIPTLNTDIVGLEPGAQYDVRVRAQNSRGWSGWSAVRTGTPGRVGGL